MAFIKKKEPIPLTQSHVFDKPFVDYKFQLKRLKGRGISIPSGEQAKIISIIKQHGYYSIVNGYGDSFEQIDTKYKHYSSDTSFEDIYAQFFIDRQLGKLLLPYLLDIEDHFSSVLSYAVAEHFDVNNFFADDRKNPDPTVISYLSYTHYPNAPIDVLKQLHDMSLNCRDDPTHWYIINKNHVPSWILFMNAELGTLTRYYKICPSSIKKEVTDELLPVKYSLNGFLNFENRRYSSGKTSTQKTDSAKSHRGKFIYSGLELMREFRNCIAHNSRVYVHTSNASLPMTVRDVPNISPRNLYTNEEYFQGTGKNDLFALFIWIIICQPSSTAQLNFIENIRNFFSGENVEQAAIAIFLKKSKLPTDFIQRLSRFANAI